jgi:hypothetical protein
LSAKAHFVNDKAKIESQRAEKKAQDHASSNESQRAQRKGEGVVVEKEKANGKFNQPKAN